MPTQSDGVPSHDHSNLARPEDRLNPKLVDIDSLLARHKPEDGTLGVRVVSDAAGLALLAFAGPEVGVGGGIVFVTKALLETPTFYNDMAKFMQDQGCQMILLPPGVEATAEGISAVLSVHGIVHHLGEYAATGDLHKPFEIVAEIIHAPTEIGLTISTLSEVLGHHDVNPSPDIHAHSGGGAAGDATAQSLAAANYSTPDGHEIHVQPDGTNAPDADHHQAHDSAGINALDPGNHENHGNDGTNTPDANHHQTHDGDGVNALDPGNHQNHDGANAPDADHHQAHDGGGVNALDSGNHGNHGNDGTNAPDADHHQTHDSGIDALDSGNHQNHDGANAPHADHHQAHDGGGVNALDPGNHGNHGNDGTNVPDADQHQTHDGGINALDPGNHQNHDGANAPHADHHQAHDGGGVNALDPGNHQNHDAANAPDADHHQAHDGGSVNALDPGGHQNHGNDGANAPDADHHQVHADVDAAMTGDGHGG